jgi:hypothetical protein
LQTINAGADGIDAPHDLVTGYHGHMRVWQFSIYDMKVSTTDTASADLDANLAPPGLTIVHLGPFKGRA